MRTLMTIAVGLIIFALILIFIKIIKKRADFRLAMWIFMPLWFCLVGWNMYYGISLGYGLMEEIPFFLINFFVPIAVAFLVFKRQFAK